MNIGEKIKNAREDLDLSQEHIANQIPMSQSGYSKIERNLQEPSLLQLKRICEILKLSADYLLSINAFKNISRDDIVLLNEIRAIIKKHS